MARTSTSRPGPSLARQRRQACRVFRSTSKGTTCSSRSIRPRPLASKGPSDVHPAPRSGPTPACPALGCRAARGRREVPEARQGTPGAADRREGLQGRRRGREASLHRRQDHGRQVGGAEDQRRRDVGQASRSAARHTVVGGTSSKRNRRSGKGKPKDESAQRGARRDRLMWLVYLRFEADANKKVSFVRCANEAETREVLTVARSLFPGALAEYVRFYSGRTIQVKEAPNFADEMIYDYEGFLRACGVPFHQPGQPWK